MAEAAEPGMCQKGPMRMALVVKGAGGEDKEAAAAAAAGE